MARIAKHHLAAERELYRPVEFMRSSRCNRRVRPGEELAAESRADKARYDFDIFLRDAEHLRQDILMVHYSLRALIECVFRSVPYGNGGVHFHRVVCFDRCDVSLVDLNRG